LFVLRYFVSTILEVKETSSVQPNGTSYHSIFPVS
jgi:hypothetical protein